LDNELTAKKEIGIKDFSFLSSPGVLGNYLECELTHIFVIERKTNHAYHYYAVCSYEEFIENDASLRDNHITEKLVKINENYSLGIQQIRLSLEESRGIFNQLCEKRFQFRNHTVILPDTMQLLPKVYVPSLFGYDGVQVNKALKPNFWGSKYILEFISIETPFSSFFSASDFDKINGEISKLISINLSMVNDRISSFIFQFPITLISVDSGISNDWCKAVLSMKVHPKLSLSSTNDIHTIVKTKLDDTTTGFNAYNGIFDHLEMNLGDSNNLELMVFNTTNAIIYEHSSVNFFRSYNIISNVSLQNAEPRIIMHPDGSSTEINLVSNRLRMTTSSEKYYDSRTKERITRNEIINHSGDFQNFYPGERDKALHYIRGKLNDFAGSSSEIWLWDPFLRHQDIMETLYYVEQSGICMKCITSYRKIKSYKEEYKDYLSFINSEKEKFLKQKNLGINLEVRAVHNNIGFSFHDRFLFFIPSYTEEIPRVYSLGTSVNSLGTTHHLIMQTVYPKNIVNAFHELWQNLNDNEESLVIKLPEGK
jgi:hypothetical protein